MPQCVECKKDFYNLPNLRLHAKRKHPGKLDVIAPLTNARPGSGTFRCKECNKCFASLGNLRFHIKKKHSDKLEELAPVEKKNYKCNQCDSQFNVLKQLVQHRSAHKIIKATKCSLCQYTAASTDILVEHYTKDHCLNIINDTLEFDSVEAFKVWKSNIEAETFASFVQINGVKKTLKHTRTTYVCHRSGNSRTRGNNVRKPKTQGSNKIGGYCPAKMTVFTSSGKCSVQFCKSHVGHGQKTDIGHLFLKKSEREKIAAKIAAKIPRQAILDEIRDSVANCNLERIHLLTKKDLYNIEDSFQLKGSSVRQQFQSPDSEELQDDFSENNLVVDVNQKSGESSGLVKTISTTRSINDVQQQVIDRKRKLDQLYQEEVLPATTLPEIEAIEKIFAALKPTLAAVRNQQQQLADFVVTKKNESSA